MSYAIERGDEMRPVVEEEIAKLQDSLPLIRNAGGWSAEEFGDMIGVTKQTVRNLETKKTRLSKTQYIAIRAVLDYELEERSDDQLFASAINLSMNSDNLTEPEKKQARAFVEGATRTGLDQKAIVTGLAALIGAAAAEAIVIGPIASVAIGATARTGLSRIIRRDERGSNNCLGGRRMSNLGWYQIMTTMAKKIGGPRRFMALLSGGGVLVGGALVAGGSKIKKRIDKSLADKKREADAAFVYTVDTEGHSNEGLSFDVGEKFKVLEVDGDVALIDKLDDKNSPYFVSVNLLQSISSYVV